MVKLAKRLLAVMAVAVALMIAGCGEQISQGEMLSKRFVPAHDEDSMMLICADPPIYQNQTDHIPDRWYVTIGKKCEDGKYRKREISVTKETYDSARKGEWLNLK